MIRDEFKKIFNVEDWKKALDEGYIEEDTLADEDFECNQNCDSCPVVKYCDFLREYDRDTGDAYIKFVDNYNKVKDIIIESLEK